MAAGEWAEPAAATITSQTGPSADQDSLPSWESVFRGMKSPGCVVHFRQVTGKYAPEEYTLRYSRDATAGAEAWRALTYNVMVTVTRPTEGGQKEVLPQRVGIRAVCAMPKSELGTGEAKARVEAILEEKGIIIPGKVEARGPISERLQWAWDWLAPQPLNAAQAHPCSAFPPPEDCEIESIDVTVTAPVTCPAGFDYEATTNSCVHHSTGGTNPGEGSSGGGGSNPGSVGGTTTPPPPPENACGDERDTIFAEYEEHGVTWRPSSCWDFTSSGGSGNFSWNELNGGFTNGNPHRAWGLVSGNLVSGLESTRRNYGHQPIGVTSGYRCPHGNASIPGAARQSNHMKGIAADMYSADQTWTEAEFDKLKRAARDAGGSPMTNNGTEITCHTYADHHLHIDY